MGSKLQSGNTAKENTDNNKTGMALDWVGVRTDVHRCQQAQLAVYRKKCQQAKIWKSDKFGKIYLELDSSSSRATQDGSSSSSS